MIAAREAEIQRQNDDIAGHLAAIEGHKATNCDLTHHLNACKANCTNLTAQVNDLQNLLACKTAACNRLAGENALHVQRIAILTQDC